MNDPIKELLRREARELLERLAQVSSMIMGKTPGLSVSVVVGRGKERILSLAIPKRHFLKVIGYVTQLFASDANRYGLLEGLPKDIRLFELDNNGVIELEILTLNPKQNPETDRN